MKQQIKRLYFIRYLCTFAILFAIIIAKTSCKKNDLLTSKNSSQQLVDINKFFNLPSNTNPAVATIAAELERQNQLTGFISHIANTAGFPVWEKSTVSLLKNETQNLNSLIQAYQGSNTCVLIPMVLEDANIVNAFIAATIINDSVTIRLYYRNDYKAYPFQANQSANGITTAEEFASQMMLFDNAVFGYINFEVKDKRLFNTSLDYTDTSHIRKTVKVSGLSTQTGGNNLQTCLDVTTTTISNHCPYPANQCPNINTGVQGPCDNCEQSCANYSTSTVSYCTGGTGTGTGGGDNWPTSPPPNIPNYPGGSGSGGDNPTGNCVVGALILNGFAPPNPCNPPGGGNPLPPIPASPPCSEYILNLQANTNFIDRMKFLNTQTVLDAPNEVGYTIRDITQYNSNSYIAGTGTVTSPTINWYFLGGTKVAGLIHSHYSGLNSIFSPDDVILMAKLFLANFAKDTNNLFFAMTSKDSPPFLMKVGNASSFRTFCEKIVGADGNDEEKQKIFARKCIGKIDSDDYYTNEKEFLKIIKDLGSENGLLLYRGDENFNKWTQKKVDAYDDVSSVECGVGQ